MRLKEYIENLQKRGILWFTKQEAGEALGISPRALIKAMERLILKNRIKVIKSDFVVIVPVEYQDRGIVPASWFIDPLMNHLNLPYYIALLSAGQFQGAAHQQPMKFQVMINKQLRSIKSGRVEIDFFYCGKIDKIPTKKIQVESGYALISTPEATALDICKYYKNCGYWSNVATVLTELIENIDADTLYSLIKSDVYELPVVQRLGYLLSLENVGGRDISEKFRPIIREQNARWTLLHPSGTQKKGKRDFDWKLYINEVVESDI